MASSLSALPRCWVAWLAVCCLAVSGGPREAAAQEEPAPPPIQLRADTIQGNFLNRFWQGRGNVTITRDGQRVRADQAEVNLETSQAKATGNVLLSVQIQRPVKERLRRRRRQAGPLTIELETQSLDYNLEASRGTATEVEGRFHNLRFNAERASVDGDQISVSQASFGACADPSPFYSLTARSIDATLGKKAVARKVGLNIGGFRVVTVPRVPIDLTRRNEARTHLPLPSIGVSRLAGGYIQWGLAFQPTPGIQTSASLQATEKEGFRYFVTTRGFSGPSPILRLFHKEERPARKVNRVLVNRLPEVGLVLDGASNSRLSDVITGELTYGHIRELTTGVSGDRLSFQVEGLPRSIGGIRDWDLDVKPGVRFSSYSTGDTYRDFYGELSLVRHLDSRNLAEFRVSQHAIGGRTPFAFDEVFIPTELYGRWIKSLGRYSLHLAARYDVRRGELFDYNVGVGFLTHCIEPRLVYHGRTQTIGLEIGLVGFSLDDIP